MNTSDQLSDDFGLIEQWLTEAGISFTVVDACPDRSCEACRPAPLSAAA